MLAEGLVGSSIYTYILYTTVLTNVYVRKCVDARAWRQGHSARRNARVCRQLAGGSSCVFVRSRVGCHCCVPPRRIKASGDWSSRRDRADNRFMQCLWDTGRSGVETLVGIGSVMASNLRLSTLAGFWLPPHTYLAANT